MKKELTKKELMTKLKLLNLTDKDQRNSVVCSLIGHSKIQTACWGYYNCGRCGDQLGDSLAGIYEEAKDVVVIDHNCEVCKKNFKKCTWKDKLYVAHPFKKGKLK